MRTWFSRHPVWFMAFYMVFYLTVFHWLEVHVTVPDIWVHCRLEDFIPLCKYAIVPYLAWFGWIPFTGKRPVQTSGGSACLCLRA